VTVGVGVAEGVSVTVLDGDAVEVAVQAGGRVGKAGVRLGVGVGDGGCEVGVGLALGRKATGSTRGLMATSR
jgi:hypothetical protein